MDDHLAKPIDGRRLLAVVARHLTRDAARDAPPARDEPTGAPPPADLARALERLSGDRALLRRIAAQFASTAADTRAKIHDAVDKRDARAVSFVAHRFRGQASAFDAAPLVSAIASLEESARRENWTAATAAVLAADAELDRLLRVLMAESTR
jgi:HPt (histidine-containing phosphotransfer) domain-containing protein